jgi:nitrate/TMAO reductase-like tetraheme cytochrome c subunit
MGRLGWLSTATLAALVIGGIAGALALGGFKTVVAYTDTDAFCLSCHEGQPVADEYRASTHFQNAAGVRARCSDCHVPHDYPAKLWRKIEATSDLYHHLIGTIDTPEKFAARRLHMAEKVWARMEANGSLACRNCHSYPAMDHAAQSQRGREKMREAAETGTTCIECHKGVAHKKPVTAADLDD